MRNTLLDTLPRELGLRVGGFGLPGLLKILAGIPRHGRDAAPIRADPVDHLRVEAGRVASPCGAWILQARAGVAERHQDLRKATRPTGLLDSIGDRHGLRK